MTHRAASRVLVAVAAVVIAAIMVLSYAAYYRGLGPGGGTVSPPTTSLISSYLGGNWYLEADRSFVATFNIHNRSVELSFLNGSSFTYSINGTYGKEFEMAGPGGGPLGGLPYWVRVYTFQGQGAYLVFEIFKANSTQLQWMLESLESKFGPPAESDGVKYYVESPYAPLVKITYVYAVYGSYLVILGSNTTSSGFLLAELAVRYALTLP